MIIVVGDIHGNLRYLKHLLDKFCLEESTVIAAGDVGLGFYREGFYVKEFEWLQMNFEKKNNNLYLLRGNHDDPKFWYGGTYKFDNSIYSNIKLIKDYDVLEIEGKRVLFIGGAISVDRAKRDRTKGSMEYWEDEKFNYQDLNEEQSSCEYLITHTSGMEEFPFSKDGIQYWIDIDPELVKDLREEREGVSKIISQMPNLKKHFYGHYHESKVEVISGSERILLDIEEAREL